MEVIVVLDGTEKRIPTAEIEALLSPGDKLTVCEARLTEVTLRDRRPPVPDSGKRTYAPDFKDAKEKKR